MTQDSKNTKHYIADEGKVFRRVYDGFNKLSKPLILGNELILGNIILNSNGDMLNAPIEDKIEYYEEVDAPERKSREEAIEEKEQNGTAED